mmetsp:Transcript_60170/g.117970  ORF Transcript_60170/g.117970 Transcript_60170/m.117970 type:complete len:430 (+) Transcript_60170:61-1350(+)
MIWFRKSAQISRLRSFNPRKLASTAPSEDEAGRRLRVLAAALGHVSTSGWSEEALARGAVDAGLPPGVHGIFGRGAIELVEYFMEETAYETARVVEKLKQEKEELGALAAAEGGPRAGTIEGGPKRGHTQEDLPVERMVHVITLRLGFLEPYVGTWAQAMALGLTPANAPTTARNLALLADEMCHTAGLVSTDARWYTERLVVGSVYQAAEVFMLNDSSTGFEDTKAFVRRRVLELHTVTDPHGNSKVDDRLKAFYSALPTSSRSSGGLRSDLSSLAKSSAEALRSACVAAKEKKESVGKRGHRSSPSGGGGAGENGAGEAAQVLFSTGASVLAGALGALFPAGEPPQRQARPESNGKHDAGRGGTRDGAGATRPLSSPAAAGAHSVAGSESGGLPVFSPPSEDDFASEEEVAEFARGRSASDGATLIK